MPKAVIEPGGGFRRGVAYVERWQVKIIACIEDPAVIERILAHLNGKAPSADPVMLPEGRARPQARLFD